MKIKRRRIAIILSTLFLIGLAATILFWRSAPLSPLDIQGTAQKLQGMPTPPFVLTTVSRANGSTCTTISQETLWETGNNAFDMTDSITNSLIATIDGVRLGKDDVEIEQYNAIQYVVKDKKLLGSYGDWTEFCLRTHLLLPGPHIATIKFTPSSGKEYSYSWVFEPSN